MIYFDGQMLSNASTYDDDAGVQTKESILHSGKKRVATSHETFFKVSFTCYTEDFNEIQTLQSKIGYYKILIIDGVSHDGCVINSFSYRQYAPGKYSYNIGFSQDSITKASEKLYANEETLTLYDNQSLSAGMTLDYPTPLLLRGLAYANISVENTGLSENFTVICYGSYDSTGSILTPVFVCNLNTTTTTRADTISNPQNYLFVHAQNDDSVHDTTFKIILSKVATL